MLKRMQGTSAIEISVSNKYAQLLKQAKREMTELRATNKKLEYNLKVAVDPNVGLRERMQVLNVQVQRDLKLKDDENEYNFRVLQNPVQNQTKQKK